MRFEMVSGKARIAANSWTIGKIRNAAGGRFGLIDAVHELIRGSLSLSYYTEAFVEIQDKSIILRVHDQHFFNRHIMHRIGYATDAEPG